MIKQARYKLLLSFWLGSVGVSVAIHLSPRARMYFLFLNTVDAAAHNVMRHKYGQTQKKEKRKKHPRVVDFFSPSRFFFKIWFFPSTNDRRRCDGDGMCTTSSTSDWLTFSRRQRHDSDVFCLLLYHHLFALSENILSTHAAVERTYIRSSNGTRSKLRRSSHDDSNCRNRRRWEIETEGTMQGP